MGKRCRADESTDESSHAAEAARGTNPFTGKPYSRRYYDILEKRKKLPCWDSKAAFLKAMEENQVVVLVGETGSGKTTQMPQFLREHGYAKKGLIAVTQPRRVAAMSVAARVAEEMDVELGNEVGYLIRFEDVTSESTVIKYMTDGMLLRECMTDSTMASYSVIVLDEAHERTLSTDVLFGLLKRVIEKRKDLKVLVMSATLDERKFQKYFDDAPLLSVSGRMFPVEVFYSLRATKDYVREAVDTVISIHRYEEDGDVLVFLTGEEEIENACYAIAAELTDDEKPVTVLPLYSSLPPQDQRRIFEQVKGRKVVIATNIAETSITIDGVVFVVDPGFSKQKVYNARTHAETLLVSPISRAAAMQRTGRAGRTKAGKCFRLYTVKAHDNELLDITYPEILRTNLSSAILMLFKLGIDDVVHFDFMDPPSPESMMRALDMLHLLGAVDDECELLELGRKMAEFPLDPQLSKMLIRGVELGVAEEIEAIVALLNVPLIYLRPRNAQKQADRAHSQFASTEGDHASLLSVFEAFVEGGKNSTWAWENYIRDRSIRSALNVKRQLHGIVEKLGLKRGEEPEHRSHAIRKMTTLRRPFGKEAARDDSQ
eukprot:GEMP01015975.1.p1 GENE.GEMP01015975.1~~GEMP01015975.1.p1  ORF type:complete len:609 (+),score=145.43 GEMP01015975.1:27-1829(+)